MSEKNNDAPKSSAQEFVISRIFDAPRERVWKAWTEPGHLAEWWGPKGFTVLVAKLELRPGGVFHYCMSAPVGSPMAGTMWGKFVYREIAEPEKIVFVNSFSDENGGITRHPMAPTWPLEVLNTQTFTEHRGKTTVTLRGSPINAAELECSTFVLGFGAMQMGFSGTFDQLAAYLAKDLAGG